MSFNFPNAPTSGDAYTNYVWDGEKWRITVNAPPGGGGADNVPSNTTPLMDGVGSPGVALDYSRGDHRHPTDTTRYPAAGGTVSGNVTIHTASPALTLDKTAGDQASSILGSVNGVSRWVLQPGNGGGEGGSNTGSNFALYRCNDAGAILDAPLTVTRSTGDIALKSLSVSGAAGVVGNITTSANFVSAAAGGLYFGPSNTKYLVHDGASTAYLAGSSLNVQHGMIVGNADIQTMRAGNPATGLVFFGNSGASYIHYSGGTYGFTHPTTAPGVSSSQGLNVAGSSVIAGNSSVSGSSYITGNESVSGTLTATNITANWSTSLSNYTTFNQAAGSIYQGSPGSISINGAGGGYCTFISFHRPGSYGVNFGLGADNRLRVGGWSLGGAWYKLWTEQDFTSLPYTPGGVVINGQLTYAGDVGITPYSYDPTPGAVVVGVVQDSYTFVAAYMRMRYVQLQNLDGGWWTMGTG